MNIISTLDASPPATSTALSVDVLIVGAGLAGLYALHRLRSLGLGVVVVEAGEGVGGTWFWNRYPGARCDVESYQYSYSFSKELEQEWRWSERFAAQPEILAYLEHVADRFDLRKDIRLGQRVTASHYDDETATWNISTAQGLAIRARYCVMATGVLSSPQSADFDGEEKFSGEILATARWPDRKIDFAGKRVAVIGTGASGTQAIPCIAAEASQLVIFQRTPNFSIPTSNAPVDDEYDQTWKYNYAAIRARQRATSAGIVFDFGTSAALDQDPEYVEAELARRWDHDGGLNFMRAFTDLGSDQRANDLAADFVRRKVASIVKDPRLAEKLVPDDYPIDSRRLATTDRTFFELFNRPDVRLVSTIDEPIVEITAKGVRTCAAEYPVDMIVKATGFTSIIGAVMDMDIRGVDGVSLREEWSVYPRAYLGLAVSGFPNMFLVNGPGSVSSLANFFMSSEVEIDWIAACIAHAENRGARAVEANGDAQAAWMADIQKKAAGGLVIKAKSSGYVYQNAAGERLFMCYPGGFATYSAALDNIAREGFRGIDFSGDRNKHRS